MDWGGDEKRSNELRGYFRSESSLMEYIQERGGKLTTLGADFFMAVPNHCVSWIHIDSHNNLLQSIADFLVGVQSFSEPTSF